ncbi:MAG TPA: hypothetical protein VLH19_05075 [Patescibacteria group bacterium]|nr:hypothetical protein [Patescibacteria group bacterium]
MVDNNIRFRGDQTLTGQIEDFTGKNGSKIITSYETWLKLIDRNDLSVANTVWELILTEVRFLSRKKSSFTNFTIEVERRFAADSKRYAQLHDLLKNNRT